MRRAFSDTLVEIAEKDPRVIFLTGDLGFQVFDEFIARFKNRYINTGIAEAQMVTMAAGLALEGFRPVIYSIASFMTARPFEQIRYCIGYPALPVTIIGAGGGFCYANSGVSHHAPDDVSLMSLIPGMTVVVPGDPHETRALLPQLIASGKPGYLRIGKFGEPTYTASAPVVLGKARLIAEGSRIAILANGSAAPIALEALKVLSGKGQNPAVFSFHTIKPLDTDSLRKICNDFKTILVMEENSPLGGLSSPILDWINQNTPGKRILRLGPPDEFALGSLSKESLFDLWRFGRNALVETCQRAWD